MAPVQYAGPLQPKKKSELQEIAHALNLSDQGTKDEIQTRIKKYLDHHQELEDDPVFAGLFGRRKRSVQPPPATTATASGRAAESVLTESKPLSRLGRRSGGLEPLSETTPVKDVRDVSTYLKHPISPLESTPNRSPRLREASSTSKHPSLPPSPTKSFVESSKAADMTTIVQNLTQCGLLQTGSKALIALRRFLSSSRNIWSLTAMSELMFILYVVIPWKTVQLPLYLKGTLTVPYPPPSTFRTPAFWSVLFHWFIPTLLAPVIAGNLISFNPVNNRRPSDIYTDSVLFDPLTAAIVHLAAQIAYPFPSIDQSGIYGLDVLGFQLRVLIASVGLAFAFAETISGAPDAFAQSLLRERNILTPRAITPAPLLDSDA